MTFVVTAAPSPPKRPGWKETRDSIGLSEVATRLLGPARTRRGGESGRSWWCCPFHEGDKNPSLCIRPGTSRWKCFGCGKSGDPIDLVRGLNPSWTFPEAVAWLTGGPARGPAPQPRPPKQTPAEPSPRPPEDWRRRAGLIVSEAAERLWSDEGADALAYLRGPKRGLTDETVRRARLGLSLGGGGVPRGITIPWGEGDDLSAVRVRRLGGTGPKLKSLTGSRFAGHLYGDVVPGKPLVIVEGEFDALLLGQELRDLAGVVTLGSASAGLTRELRLVLSSAWPRFVALDNDGAGESASGGWPSHLRRVKPPGDIKDWTEMKSWGPGVDLRRWWGELLAGAGRPPLFTWGELASWRWGDDIDDPSENVIVGRPDPQKMLSALRAAGDDPEAMAEREAIRAESSFTFETPKP